MFGDLLENEKVVHLDFFNGKSTEQALMVRISPCLLDAYV